MSAGQSSNSHAGTYLHNYILLMFHFAPLIFHPERKYFRQPSAAKAYNHPSSYIRKHQIHDIKTN